MKRFNGCIVCIRYHMTLFNLKFQRSSFVCYTSFVLSQLNFLKNFHLSVKCDVMKRDWRYTAKYAKEVTELDKYWLMNTFLLKNRPFKFPFSRCHTPHSESTKAVGKGLINIVKVKPLCFWFCLFFLYCVQDYRLFLLCMQTLFMIVIDRICAFKIYRFSLYGKHT